MSATGTTSPPNPKCDEPAEELQVEDADNKEEPKEPLPKRLPSQDSAGLSAKHPFYNSADNFVVTITTYYP